MNRIALDTLILIALCNIVLIAPANAELKLGNKLAVAELANTQPKNLDSTQINTKSGNPLTPSNPVNASDKKHENPAKLSDNDRINLMIAEVLAAGVSSDHALKYFETQFDLIHKIYGIATGSIALLLLLAGVVGYKNINKIGEEAKSDFRDFENRMDRDLKNLRERLQNDIKQSQEAAKDQLEKEVKTLIEGEGSHQEKVDGRLAELTATIWEEFDNAAKISDCYSNVRMFESFMSLIKSIEEIESLGSIKQQKIEKTMEPLKQALEGSLKKLKQIITVYEGKRYDSDRLARVYACVPMWKSDWRRCQMRLNQLKLPQQRLQESAHIILRAVTATDF